ncbi:hypothetical protein MACH01_39220 [Thalassospira tepidiphila]|nr:hypothetical protein MACH01_39220 [Thalassospira tepidiphila]
MKPIHKVVKVDSPHTLTLENGNMANLDEFILQTFRDIHRAVQTFNEEAGDNIAAPAQDQRNPDVNQAIQRAGYMHLGRSYAINVDFDVAVTAEDTTSADAGARIDIKVLSIGAGVDAENRAETVSRTKFRIPLKL